MEREKKWNKMTNNWKNFKGTEKLRKRIYKGIPDSFRSRVWGFLLDIESSRQQQKGKYEVCCVALNQVFLKISYYIFLGNARSCP